MEKPVYIDRLQHLAKLHWKKKLPDEVLAQIFLHTELHPFYMNVLCQTLWEKHAMLSVDDVDLAWHNYVKTQKTIISHDVIKLSLNQRKILVALARSPVKEIQSTEFTAPIKISASSAQQAIAILVRKDIVYQDSLGFYRILDPAIRYYLETILWNNYP